MFPFSFYTPVAIIHNLAENYNKFARLFFQLANGFFSYSTILTSWRHACEKKLNLPHGGLDLQLNCSFLKHENTKPDVSWKRAKMPI